MSQEKIMMIISKVHELHRELLEVGDQVVVDRLDVEGLVRGLKSKLGINYVYCDASVSGDSRHKYKSNSVAICGAVNGTVHIGFSLNTSALNVTVAEFIAVRNAVNLIRDAQINNGVIFNDNIAVVQALNTNAIEPLNKKAKINIKESIKESNANINYFWLRRRSSPASKLVDDLATYMLQNPHKQTWEGFEFTSVVPNWNGKIIVQEYS